VSSADVAIGVGIGFVAGVLSGIFGIGGGVVMTPGIQVLLGAPPIVALATPLPAIFPTALAGALAYRRRGELDPRAAAWLVGPGLIGAIGGALLTEVIDTALLLVVTALLLAWQALGILRSARRALGPAEDVVPPAPALAAVGLVAGVVSGLLGIGGGLVIVPALAGWLGMPLKRAVGTSLVAVVVLVIPGTVVHTTLGHVDLGIFLSLVVGSVPGARLGAAFALEARERTLRLIVGAGLLAIAATYAVDQAVEFLRSGTGGLR
jgi:uncharacterized membrane protein YfcA